MKLLIQRISQTPQQTLSKILLLGHGPIEEYTALELPWVQNAQNKSCIPTGSYKGIRYKHPTRGKSLVILDVPGRTDIMMHVANYKSDLSGCIAPGIGFKDLNKDGLLDVQNSRSAMNSIYDALPDKFEVEIYNLSQTQSHGSTAR